MSQPKPAVTTFQSDWAKVKGWAQGQKIPETAVNNVYNLDLARMQSGGYQMGNDERTRAILAAAGMNYSTPLPSDSPGASNVIGNTVSNARGIFTGLIPTRLVSNIWDTLKTTVDDVTQPGRLASHGGIDAALTTTALSWIPGAYDIGTYLDAGGGEKGLAALAKQPLSTVLDVMPALKGVNMAGGALATTGSVGDAAIAGAQGVLGPRLATRLGVPAVGASEAATAMATVLSDRLGIAPKAVSQLGLLRIGGKALGSIKVGMKEGILRDHEGNVIMDENNEPVIGQITLSQRAAEKAQAWGVGHVLSRTAHAFSSANTTGTQRLRSLTATVHQTIAALDEKQLNEFTTVMHSGRKAEDIVNDDAVSLPVKEAVQAYQPWEEWHQKTVIESGHLLPVPHPDGTVSYYESGSPVHGLAKAADLAHAAADKASIPTDILTQQALTIDKMFAPMMGKIDEMRNQIAGLPAMMPQLNATFLKTFGRLAGKDGILEQMRTAYNAQDWATFNKRAADAMKLMDTKSFQRMAQVKDMQTLRGLLFNAREYGRARLALFKKHEVAYEGRYKTTAAKSVRVLNEKAAKADEEFIKYMVDHPPGEARDAVLGIFMRNFLASDEAERLMYSSAQYLKDNHYDAEDVDRLVREDPGKMYQLIVAIAGPTFDDPFIPGLQPEAHFQFMADAKKEYDSVRARGDHLMYVPTVSADDAANPLLRGDRAYINPLHYPTLDAAKEKAFDMANSILDVSLGINKATMQVISRDGSIDLMNNELKPMLLGESGLRKAIGRKYFGDIAAEKAAGVKADIQARISNDMNLERFDIPSHFGLKNSDFGLDDNEVYYLPREFTKQLGNLLGRDQFPLHGAWDATTRVFKWSILGLSPRYTAHILFGGTSLLALRIDPSSFLMVGRAVKMVRAYHMGETTDHDDLFQGAAQYGTPDQQFAFRAGRSMLRIVLQEKLAKLGIDHTVATAAQWAKVGADANFKFTNYISNVQRSIAYLDGIKKAGQQGWINDPITGERVTMTEALAHHEGLKAAERVMGNLQAMTPLERSVARKIMPFYGWTKHILKFVLTYPVDHPWRTSFLATLAEQNSESFSKGLDMRMQLLFFLGQPDTSGNVTGIDVRALDPLRDVANYATLGGWISGLNPILVAPVAAIDPSIIYGDNTLYPNVTYDSVYGTNVAQPSGGWLTAMEQEIPELGALDQALGLSAQARAVKKEGGSAALKDMLSSLGFPWTPQQLNLQQISAKHELDRYNQAATDALNAWQTGDFSTLMTYPGTVPDPLQKDYNVTPQALYQQYQEALKKYPGLPPSETVVSLPAPTL